MTASILSLQTNPATFVDLNSTGLANVLITRRGKASLAVRARDSPAMFVEELDILLAIVETTRRERERERERRNATIADRVTIWPRTANKAVIDWIRTNSIHLLVELTFLRWWKRKLFS